MSTSTLRIRRQSSDGTPTSTLSVLRVFVDAEGRRGNGLGVFLDGPAVPPGRRQAVAAELGFAETVFVEDVALGVLRIFTPAVELELAGHPLVGTSWLLAHEGLAVPALHPPAGTVQTWSEGEMVFIRADPRWSPPFELLELPSAEEVERHPMHQRTTTRCSTSGRGAIAMPVACERVYSRAASACPRMRRPDRPPCVSRPTSAGR